MIVALNYMYVGGFDCKVYCATVYSRDGRTGGVEFGAKYVCDGAS